MILKHDRADTHHWPVLQIVLEMYQLYAGLADPIPEDTLQIPDQKVQLRLVPRMCFSKIAAFIVKNSKPTF